VLLPRTKRQQLQLLSQHPSNLELEDSDDEYDAEIDFYVGYRRPEIIKVNYVIDLDDDSELPKHITERLAQIRALALEKYREVHG
jgi:hypothetical protein